jgi:DNA-binding transcriptional LysR family regulator
LFAVEESAGLLKRLPVKHMSLTRKFFVYRRRRSAMPPALQRFLDALRNPES